jgi:hypothetical protein
MSHTTPYVFQTSVERKINALINNDVELTHEALNQVYITAQVEEGVALYRMAADNMKLMEVRTESHDSKKLAEKMESMGDPRPHDLCHAHAIVSGAHAKAATLRLILAKYKRRIDDPLNGCWLPKNTKAKSYMPERLKNAMPHSRVHRYQYYLWLNSIFRPSNIKNQQKLDQLLVEVSFKLQTGSFPPEVMLKADQQHGAF